MTRIRISAALLTFAFATAGTPAQTVSPSQLSEASVTVPAANGTAQTAHVSVQSWVLPGQGHATREFPLRGFFVAHLLSGHLAATTDGQTTDHLPGDYWAVTPGGTMQVKVLGELAVVETIVVTKQ